MDIHANQLIGLMTHALGKDGFRNYYAAEPADKEAKGWEALVELGLAVRGRAIPGGLVYYHVTDAGVAALRVMFPRRFKREMKGIVPEMRPKYGG